MTGSDTAGPRVGRRSVRRRPSYRGPALLPVISSPSGCPTGPARCRLLDRLIGDGDGGGEAMVVRAACVVDGVAGDEVVSGRAQLKAGGPVEVGGCAGGQ